MNFTIFPVYNNTKILISICIIIFQSSCKGEIRIANVRFRYPTRRNAKVLRNLNFNVQPGQTVALVGTSGCGKSTSVSLVERFYDARSGSVVRMLNNV
jgi:ABC-type multidrug transport system fused ATPase/permease subunit